MIRTAAPARLALRVATPEDRDEIGRLRHEVFARELGQHPPNAAGRLRDGLDDANVFLAAVVEGRIAGFVSVTPPEAGAYSMDKYVPRDRLPFPFDDALYEIRLLTVLQRHRGSELALLLMHAALRWIESRGGTRVMAIGRREVVDLYLRRGLRKAGLDVKAGAVTYDVLHAGTAEIRDRAADIAPLLERLEKKVDWRLPLPFRRPAPCFHGGAFFEAVGPRFDSLQRRHDIVNADVLDAWFPPAPGVLASLKAELPWLLQTSPPAAAEGLVEAIAAARGVAPRHLLCGAGSSDLIFRALRHWLTPASRVLLPDPTYGEYAHVLQRVIGCVVDRLPLSRDVGYVLDPARLEAALDARYDLAVLVNPNSPTGRHVPRAALEPLLRRAPPETRIWIDETYVDYAGPGESLERFAARSDNVVVCKSMSKAYALSGVRVAYLCAGAQQLEPLRAVTPPWAVGLPSQLAAVRALEDPAYYEARWTETKALREGLAERLRGLGFHVLPGIANFLLLHLPPEGPTAADVVARCRARGVFLRDASTMGPSLGPRSLRIAVKDVEGNRRIVDALREHGGML